MSTLAVFLLLGGASAIAATKGKIGTKQIKAGAVTAAKLHRNAVRPGKIRNAAVIASKLADNAVVTDKLAGDAVVTDKIAGGAVVTGKLADDAVTGQKVNESTLGEVPSANTAANVVGRQIIFTKLGFGESQTIATNGAVSFVAQCATGVGGTNDRVRILAQTTENGAALDGQSDRHGPTEFLEVATPEDSRVLVSLSQASGQVNVSGEIDQGFVMAPDGKMITTNSEGLALGLNYAGSQCLVAGVMDLVG